MTLSYDFAGIGNFEPGSPIPPEGAYETNIVSAEQEPNKDGTGHNLVVERKVVSGEHVNKTARTWYALPNPTDDKDKAEFKLSKLRSLLISLGASEVSLQGKFSFEESELVNQSSVIYIQDMGEKEDGKKNLPNILDVMPQDRAAALARQWTPGGGSAASTGNNGQAGGATIGGMQQQAQAQAQAFNAQQAPPAQQTGGLGQASGLGQQQAAPQGGAAIGGVFGK